MKRSRLLVLLSAAALTAGCTIALPRLLSHTALDARLSYGYAMLSSDLSEDDLPVDFPSFLVVDNPQVEETVADPVSPDSDGTLELEDEEPLDFVFPSAIQGEPVQAIGANAFSGCALFRTVTIPASIVEIGEDAFADCPNLEYIILEGRLNSDDMSLGDNWNGGAAVLYGLVLQPISEPGDMEQGLTGPDTGAPELPDAETPDLEEPDFDESDSELPQPEESAPDITEPEESDQDAVEPDPAPEEGEDPDQDEAEPEPELPEDSEVEPVENPTEVPPSPEPSEWSNVYDC